MWISAGISNLRQCFPHKHLVLAVGHNINIGHHILIFYFWSCASHSHSLTGQWIAWCYILPYSRWRCGYLMWLSWFSVFYFMFWWCHGSVSCVLCFDSFVLLCPFSVSCVLPSVLSPHVHVCLPLSASIVSSVIPLRYLTCCSTSPVPRLVISVCVLSLCLPACLSVVHTEFLVSPVLVLIFVCT